MFKSYVNLGKNIPLLIAAKKGLNFHCCLVENKESKFSCQVRIRLDSIVDIMIDIIINIMIVIIMIIFPKSCKETYLINQQKYGIVNNERIRQMLSGERRF